MNIYVDFDDCLSICLLGLSKAGKSYDSTRNTTFSTYAYKVIQNELFMHYRQASRSIEYRANCSSLNDVIYKDTELLDIIADDNEPLHESVSKTLLLEKLRDEICKLPYRYKFIIVKYLQGNTMNEIADKLNVSQPTISKQYYKALDILRNKLHIFYK